MYRGADFDLVGFALGAMERGRDLPRDVAEGDVILSLVSDGVHSNGFSLVRAIAAAEGLGRDAHLPFGRGTLARLCLRRRGFMSGRRLPRSGRDLGGGVRGIAHITGGGLTENVPRTLPEGLAARFDLGSWRLPPVFRWLATKGRLGEDDLIRTFNAGIGLVLVVAPDRTSEIAKLLRSAGETVIPLGEVGQGQGLHYAGRILWHDPGRAGRACARGDPDLGERFEDGRARAEHGGRPSGAAGPCPVERARRGGTGQGRRDGPCQSGRGPSPLWRRPRGV